MCMQILKNVGGILNKTNLIENFEFMSSKENFESSKENFKLSINSNFTNKVKELNKYEEKFTQLKNRFTESKTQNNTPDNLKFLNKKRDSDPNIHILENIHTQLKKLENNLNVSSKFFLQKYDNYKDIKKEELEEYLVTLDYTKIRYKWSKSSKNNELFNNLQTISNIEDQLIIDVFKSIDRKDFAFADSNPYLDKNVRIGWNASIPQPKFYVKRLNSISNNFPFKKGPKKILDIGSGSGYFTLCLCKFFGPDSIVYGIDHIPEIVDLSLDNINKNHSNYMESGRIKFYVRDARDGLPDEGPFDIIHFGISHFEIPKKIVDQLAVGGMIWIALGSKKLQQLTIAKKELDGSLSQTVLAKVKFVHLMDKYEQLAKKTEEN
jgi:protein-L-isoaspartate(D-aspartate) O-methyltransferase